MSLSGTKVLNDQNWGFLQGGGEMAGLIRKKDWSTGSLGRPENWPQSLRTALSILVRSKFPMFLFWGPDLICFYNDAFRPSLGEQGKHPDILGQKGADEWSDIWPIIKPWIDQVLKGGESTWMEDQLVPFYRNGKTENIWWTFSYSAVTDESDEIAGVFITCVETTQKVRSLGNLQVSDQRFQNLIREASIGIIVLNGPDMVVELVNTSYGKLIDRSPAELLGKRLFDIIPDAEKPFRAILDQVRLTGKPLSLYAAPYLVHSNGKKIEGFLDVIYQPYKEADGAITGVMALVHDVTDRTRSGKKIEDAELKARLAIESGDLGTYEIDLLTDHMTTSDRFNVIWGISSSMHRSRIAERIHPADRELRLKAHQKSLINGYIHYESRVIWEDQSEHWVKVKGKVLYNDEGKPITLIGVIQDITEQKKFADELTKQVKERTLELQRSNDDLLQFAHVISHDLKEPVRKIRIFSGRINDEMKEALPTQTQTYLSKITSSASRMYDMIEGVLNYSSLSSSREAIECVDLNDTMKSIQTDLEVVIQKKNARFTYSALPVIKGAPILIYQLFYNVINNSLKFSQIDIAPLITITSESIKEDGRNFAKLIVSDNGIGFEQEHAATVFNFFSRLNSKDRYEGTGLGLALSKKIVERHGGNISALSAPNQGASIIIKLPAND